MLIVPNRVELIRHFPRFGVGAEIGVFKGEFAQMLLRVCQPEVMYLVDHWLLSLRWGPPINAPGELFAQDLVLGDAAYRECRATFAAEIASGRVRVLHGASEEWMPRLPNKSLDWVYIDADHSYEGASIDLRLAWPKVKPGGWIAGHDYCPLFPGVIQAVDEFCEEFRLAIDIMTDEPPMIVPGAEPTAFNSFAIRMR